ncbi:MAG: hypothetical protein KA796_13795 [Chryseobacterium sp.]|nr:hypothetical protein [Chryseobacterium sp.]MBP7500916.1 hypothetical protein [Chryseobacterium sp.]
MNKNEKILFKNFLYDKNAYNLNSGYWKRKLLKNLDLKFSIENQYILNRKSDGKNFYDGNPIFSYVENNKAFRIIQENPEELRDINDINNIKPIDAWIDNLYLRDNSYSIPELVISLYLTQETVKKCIELIKEFRFDRLTKNNIQEFI